MRLIDADALLARVDKEREYLTIQGLWGAEHILTKNFRNLIDDAPTVPLPDFKEGYKQAILDGKTNFSRPQGEWNYIQPGMYACPFCGAMSHLVFKNFCANCGAKLRGNYNEK